jgi:hypothetical protein
MQETIQPDGAETIVGLNFVGDGGGRTRNGGSLTAIRTPALTVIPANARIQCFSRLCLVAIRTPALTARVRAHDIHGPRALEEARQP